MARRRRPARPGALADLAPSRILTQIVILQLLYYAVATVLIGFVTLVSGNPLSPELFLDWQLIRGDITAGWTLALCWMMTSFICVIFLLLFIARSKLVPDFAITIHVINLIVTSFYTGLVPRELFWWGLQIASAGLMTFLGIWACRWRELKPIQFGGKGKTRAAPDASSSSAGVYEMVDMESKDEAV